MKLKATILLIMVFVSTAVAQTENTPKTIHVFVALCDNVNQGI